MLRLFDFKFRDWLQDEFHAERFLPNLAAILFIGFLETIFTVSMGSLIFSGELSIYLPYGIRIALSSFAITTIATSLTSSASGIIASVQDSPAVIQGIALSGLYAALSTSSESAILATVLTILLVTSLLTGLFFWVLGFFKLGGLARYIPYPVVGGFLAGTGWLLVRASFGVMADLSLTFSNIPLLLQPDRWILWLPGSIIAIVLVVGLRRSNHVFVLPGVVIGAILLFYLVLFITGTSIDTAINRGLLLGEFSNKITWQPLHLGNLALASWDAILAQAGSIISIFIVSILSLLLNTTGLELATEQDIDINHELRAAGVANILSGIGGGMIGFQTLSLSALGHRLKAKGRFVGIGIGIMAIVILFSGASFLSYFPKMVSGGLLLFLGIDFLFDWLIAGWKKLSKTSYGIVVLILVVIGFSGFLAGVGVGLLATVFLFVVNYSRVSVIRHKLSGIELRSNVERYDHQWHKLHELGDHILILELQGYIFFGTAYALLEQIQSRMNDQNRLPVRFLIFDFRHVNGLDVSAVFSFMKCCQSAEAQNTIILLTHASESIQHKFRLGGFLDKENIVRLFPDLDRGLEWCEDQLLEASKLPEMQTPKSLGERLIAQGFPGKKITSLLQYLDIIHVESGGHLIRQGDVAEDLYLIESGKVSVYLELENHEKMRIQTLSKRVVVGELGLYA